MIQNKMSASPHCLEIKTVQASSFKILIEALKELLTPSVLRDALASFDAFVADARAARLIASAGTAAAFVADPTNGLRNFDEHAACPRAQLVHVGFLVAAKLRTRVATLRGASVSCGQMAADGVCSSMGRSGNGAACAVPDLAALHWQAL
jgi:hypothetical protein